MEPMTSELDVGRAPPKHLDCDSEPKSLQASSSDFSGATILEVVIVLTKQILNMLLFFLASNGVVLAAEKKQKSVLYDDSTINKVCFC